MVVQRTVDKCSPYNKLYGENAAKSGKPKPKAW